MVKREFDDGDGSSNVDPQPVPYVNDDADNQTLHDRRDLRSRYLAVMNKINDEREEIAKPDSDAFDLIFGEMESLHQLVTNPREQVADAQVLLDFTKTLVESAKAHAHGGLTPSDFVTHILKKFGGQGGTSTGRNSIAWKDIGVAVSNIFGVCYGCSTMIGPIDAKTKQRKVINRNKRVRSTELARPEELGEGLKEEIKDGRAEIKVDEAGRQLVCELL
ncbi:Non-structural maintenance of chromosome element 4 [Sesbania bispinosa]|nr:Non-structural maintenance of chromosome element 4 [Sesbania bispinosa]